MHEKDFFVLLLYYQSTRNNKSINHILDKTQINQTLIFQLINQIFYTQLISIILMKINENRTSKVFRKITYFYFILIQQNFDYISKNNFYRNSVYKISCFQMQKACKIRIILVFILAIFVALPAPLLWYLGYVPSVDWNVNAQQTIGTVIGHTVTQTTCSQRCRCVTTCTPGYKSSSTCRKICETCYYNCYDGQIIVDYSVSNVTYVTNFFILNNNEQSTVYQSLQYNHPNGTKLRIYYNPQNPQDVRRQLIHSQGFYIAFFVLIGIGSLIVFVWGVCEAVQLYRNCTNKETQVIDQNEVAQNDNKKVNQISQIRLKQLQQKQ